MREPAQPLHRELDLTHTHGERNAERCFSRLPNHAVGNETVAGLEPRYRPDTRRIEGVATNRELTRRPVAEGHQQTAERRHPDIRIGLVQRRDQRRQGGERRVGGEHAITGERAAQRAIQRQRWCELAGRRPNPT